MNYSMIRYVLFRLLRVFGLLLVLPLLVALIYREYDSALVFVVMAVVCFAAGYAGSYKKPGQQTKA